MKRLSLPRGRKRGTVTLLLCLLLTVLLLALNLLLPYLLELGNVYVDLTPEGLYTLTERLSEELADIERDVDIYFLDDRDRLLGSTETKYTYVMCRELEKTNERIHVRHLDLTGDPSSVDPFRGTQGTVFSSTDVIVSSGGRYKVLSAASFFADENDAHVAYNGEYRIATAILSVTTYAEGPQALFAVGHGERYYVEGDEGSDASLSLFASLLRDLGLRVGKISLDEADALPEDCVLLLFVGTTEDYSAGDIYDFSKPSAMQKVDRFLDGKRSVMVFRDALGKELPVFDGYLEEWGFTFTQSLVTDKESSLGASIPGSMTDDRLIGVYPTKDNAAIGYSMMQSVADLATPPKTVLANCTAVDILWEDPLLYLSSNVSRCVSTVFFASPTARVQDGAGYTIPARGTHVLAAVSAEARLSEGEHTYGYLFAAGSTAMISNEYLGDNAFGNGDVMFSVLRTLSRTDVYASTELGGFDMNAYYGGKMFEGLALSEGATNTVFYSLEAWDDYAGVTTGRLVAVLIPVFFLPVLAVPLTATIILRRRRGR